MNRKFKYSIIIFCNNVKVFKVTFDSFNKGLHVIILIVNGITSFCPVRLRNASPAAQLLSSVVSRTSRVLRNSRWRCSILSICFTNTTLSHKHTHTRVIVHATDRDQEITWNSDNDCSSLLLLSRVVFLKELIQTGHIIVFGPQQHRHHTPPPAWQRQRAMRIHMWILSS